MIKKNKQEIPTDVILADNKREIKSIRNRLLLSTDYTQIPDVPLSSEKVEEFALYRQELRQIADKYDYLHDVIWPSKPL